MPCNRVRTVKCRLGTGCPRQKRWLALVAMAVVLAMQDAVTGFCGNARFARTPRPKTFKLEMRVEKPGKVESTEMATTQEVDLLEAMSDKDAKEELVRRIPRSIEQDDGSQEMVEQATKVLGGLALLALPIVAFGLKAFFDPINEYLDTKESYANYCGSPAYAYKKLFAPGSECIDTSAPKP
mmetsp:Transcript_21219/g.38730  ORF Transcript_21219/g.38730 Transcript_21219/m.38730 type:complete len:182 (+) Transcript_21219:59-604(+)